MFRLPTLAVPALLVLAFIVWGMLTLRYGPKHALDDEASVAPTPPRAAPTVNLLHEPAPIARALAAFRSAVEARTPLISVTVDDDEVAFTTDQTEKGMFGSLPSFISYRWSVAGLQRALGAADTSAIGMGATPATFDLADYDWSGFAKLQADARAKLALPQAAITEMRLAKTNRHPGAPVLEWTIDIEKSKIYADAKGAIIGVELPESQRAKTPVNWFDPATMEAALGRLGANFGPDTRIATIKFDDWTGGRVTIEEVAASGQFATFDFTADGVKRADLTFALDTGKAELRLADVTILTEAKLAALEDAAMKKVAAGKTGYLHSVTIGPNGFDPEIGAKAVTIYLRDIPVDSAKAEYGWALYDFDGRYVDGVSLE